MSLKKETVITDGRSPEFQVREVRQYPDDEIREIRFQRHTNQNGEPWGGIQVYVAKIFPKTTREVGFYLDNDERRALIEWLQKAEPVQQ